MSPQDIARMVLSSLIVCGFGFVVIAWMIYPPTERNDILIALSATLGTGYLQVLSYWFQKGATTP